MAEGSQGICLTRCSFLQRASSPACRGPVTEREEQLCAGYGGKHGDMPVAMATAASGERCLSGTNLLLQTGTVTKGKASSPINLSRDYKLSANKPKNLILNPSILGRSCF